MSKTSLYGGWPLVPSTKWPGEHDLQCPECRSTNIVLTTEPGPLGTGPGGRFRLGDPGSRGVAVCKGCGAKGYHSDKAAV